MNTFESPPSTDPRFNGSDDGRLGRWLMRAPAIDQLFRFRIPMMATK